MQRSTSTLFCSYVLGSAELFMPYLCEQRSGRCLAPDTQGDHSTGQPWGCPCSRITEILHSPRQCSQTLALWGAHGGSSSNTDLSLVGFSPSTCCEASTPAGDEMSNTSNHRGQVSILGPPWVLHDSLALPWELGIPQEPSGSAVLTPGRTYGLSSMTTTPNLPAYSTCPLQECLRLFCSKFFIWRIKNI